MFDIYLLVTPLTKVYLSRYISQAPLNIRIHSHKIRRSAYTERTELLCPGGRS